MRTPPSHEVQTLVAEAREHKPAEPDAVVAKKDSVEGSPESMKFKIVPVKATKEKVTDVHKKTMKKHTVCLSFFSLSLDF